VSDDIEALLRSGMAERVDAAPVFDDPGLADAAIAGAGRLRRQRRFAAAASGAGLLVLGAATFVWQPWTLPDKGDDGMLAADTSTAEAQRELDMEFVVETDDGTYEVINQDDTAIPIGEEEPLNVFRLSDAYVVESATAVETLGLDGSEGVSLPKTSEFETQVRINQSGEQFAVVTPTDEEYEYEQYSVFDASAFGIETLATEGDADADASADAFGEGVEPASFTLSAALTVVDWSATTAVFSADLVSTSGGNAGPYLFNQEYDWGLESVGEAGFDSVVIADSTDPNYLCVADLDPGVGVATANEECGPADSAEVEEYLAVASSGESDALAISDEARAWQEGDHYLMNDADLGEDRARFENAENWWTDPLHRWQLAANPGDRTWLLLEATDDGSTTLSELSPPNGALMPVLSYT
jgi:hypothetical protein